MSYAILYPFSYILSQPLTGYLLHFLIENIIENEYSNLHPFDISIDLNTAIVTFVKKLPDGQLLLKKFIFKYESSSYVINLLS